LALDGPINGVWFQAYIDQVLVPTLTPGDIVVMNNLGSHKGVGVLEAIEAAGATLLYLPPTVPTLIQSRRPFRYSRRSSERPLNGPSTDRSASQRVLSRRTRQLLRRRSL
jgi:transposase